MFEFLGLTFHLYGLLLGLAGVVVVVMAEWIAKPHLSLKVTQNWEWLVILLLVGSVVGARLWHVATEWSEYSDVLSVVYVWRGGLSIFGALVGLLVTSGLLVVSKKLNSAEWLVLVDSLALSLPWGQMIGRWGNYVNQELYGYPTSLPWGIPIDPEFRLARFAGESHFHPLFFYEILGLLVFVVLSWLHRWSLGQGKLAWWYLVYYAVLRLVLDAGRPDKTMAFSIVGVNQLLMLLTLICLLGISFIHQRKHHAP